MLFFSANPETLDAWKAHYRHKLALILVIYLVLPVAKDEFASAESAISSTVLPTPQDLPLQRNAITGIQQAVTLDATAPSPSPLTPPYEHGSASSVAAAGEKEEASKRNAMPEKGSTSRDSNSSSSWSATPPISPPPPRPQQSGGADSVKEGAAEHKKGQEDELDVQRPSPDFSRQSRPSPLTLPSPPPNSELADAFEEFSLFLISSLNDLLTTLLEWRPSPFHLFAFLMHVLCLVQLVALLVEDSIVRTTMADPLPKELPRGSTWGKRFSRWSWRGRQLTRRYKGAMGTSAVCAVVCAWVGWEAVMVHEGKMKPGWNDVPAARWVSGMIQEVVEDEGRRCPFRLVVIIETLAALISLVQPLKHLLPASILPPTLSPPALLFPSSRSPSRSATPRVLSPTFTPSHSTPTSPASSSPPSPSRSPASGAFFTFPPPPPPLALETHWLLLHLDSLLQSFLSLFQFALLLPLLPRSTYSLFHPAPHILLLSMRGRLIAIGNTRDKMRRTVECLRIVFDEFPETEAAAEGGRKERGEDLEEDWVCTICFEGIEEEEIVAGGGGVGGSGYSSPSLSGSNSPALLGGEATAPKGTRTMKARCRLPCSHRYHAGCLTTWLQYQSWCPSCHTAITSKRSDLAEPATPLAPLFPQQPVEVDTSDIYPGTRRRIHIDEQ